VILLFAAINRRRDRNKGTFQSNRTISVRLSDSLDRLQCRCLASPMESGYRGIGITDDGEHEQNVRRRFAAYRGSLSIQPSEICLSGSLQIAHWLFAYGMAI
jgi:hypothetical protein